LWGDWSHYLIAKIQLWSLLLRRQPGVKPMHKPVEDWNDADWRRYDIATARISGPKADAFARALDLCGWMIVPQLGDGRWPMETDGPCPSWAQRPRPPATSVTAAAPVRH
jgi:hypothetical protein